MDEDTCAVDVSGIFTSRIEQFAAAVEEGGLVLIVYFDVWVGCLSP